MSGRVTLSEISVLAPQIRCAWSAVCAEALTRLYSERFQQIFDTETAYSIVWGYIETGVVDSKEAKRYIRKCTRIGNSDAAYNYGMPNGMLAALVAETLYQSGESAVECIGYCARLYPNILFFKHGIDDRMGNFNRFHIDALTAKYNRFSQSILQRLSRINSDYQREQFRSLLEIDSTPFVLPDNLFDQNPVVTGRKEPTVPIDEILLCN